MLAAQGLASEKWNSETTALSRFLPGVTRFDGGGLVSAKHLDMLTAHRTQIESTIVHFDIGVWELNAEAEAILDILVNTIQGVINASQAIGVGVQIQTLGRTSSDGAEETNTKLREARANRVVAALTSRGINPASLIAITEDNLLRDEITDEDKSVNRSVSFRINFTEVPEVIRKALQP